MENEIPQKRFKRSNKNKVGKTNKTRAERSGDGSNRKGRTTNFVLGDIPEDAENIYPPIEDEESLAYFDRYIAGDR